MTEQTPVLLLGATGYIGGAVLSKLLAKRQSTNITALVRNAEKATILQSKFGVKAVVGTHQELDKVERLAQDAHVVFNLADADDELLVKAILSGAKTRHALLGESSVLIHTESTTSGTYTLVDDARGEYPTDLVYDDLNVDQIKSIPNDAAHRKVDLLITDADSKGYVRTHIVLPSMVYGIADHALVDAGVSNATSQNIPALARAALDRKRAGVVGKGRAIRPNVHVDDMADLYVALLDSIVRVPARTGHGWEGFYFGENGEHTWLQVSKAIGDALVHFGIASESEPTPFTTEELVKYFGSEKQGFSYGANARCRANRAHAIGWKPKFTTDDMLKSIRPAVEAILEKQNEGALE
ncbi:NAD(P)-binding protein [Fomes fomentarius]|nr:NAD(P)-binding protein [Fomes fomentarius]